MRDDQRGHDHSYWRATTDASSLAPLQGLADADVTVVGGGIVGLTTAALAAEAGLRVVVLEARGLANGTTGGTTGKLTAQNETRLARLRSEVGADAARHYARANQRGIEIFDRLVADHAIACDREEVPAHLVALTEQQEPSLHEEAAAAREAGLTVEVGPAPDEVPFAGRPCLTVPDQRQMHAVRYCHGLAASVLALGGAVHEHARVVDVVRQHQSARRWRVLTEQAEVRSDHVVLATRLPAFRDGRLLFGRTKSMSAVGVSARLDGPAPRGMYLFQESRTWSVRSSRTDGAGEHLIAVGMSEPTAASSALDGRTGRLEGWVREHFPVTSVDHAWMAEDQSPSDGRPYVGALPGDGLWTATGFGKWGLAFGSAAAEALVTRLQGGPDPFAGCFDTNRVEPPAGWRQMLRYNLRVGGLFVGDRLRALPAGDLTLEPGEGRLVRRGRTPTAVARTRDGPVHAVSATCTHLGCLVRWNAEEETWDCGCHGSRFTADGEVLEAPATRPLRRIDLDGQGG
ncbi:FAD-dependent oxidoreductase [Egicoccus sp. AB-alg2]|uniref:FAD-dependent oxidoreductase n=1 Tax=Egicoccus sp. AB-alg2 TaxID=3242693 RepID=UPI00359D914C